MKRTLANLERQESAIVELQAEGQAVVTKLRQKLAIIRQNCLYEAAGFDSFDAYAKSDRLPLSSGYARRLASAGEAELLIEQNAPTGAFSDSVLQEVSKARVVDSETGKRTHNLHQRNIKVIGRELSKREAKGETITAKVAKEVRQQVEERSSAPPPMPRLGPQLESHLKRANTLRRSYEDLYELDPNCFLDADSEYPGCVKRLAKAYSNIASLLRKVLK